MYFGIQKFSEFRKVIYYKFYICGLRQHAVIECDTISVVKHINIHIMQDKEHKCLLSFHVGFRTTTVIKSRQFSELTAFGHCE